MPFPDSVLALRGAAVAVLLGGLASVTAHAQPAPLTVDEGATFTLDGPSGVYPIHVTLPPGYDPDRPTPYPALYYADAWWLAELVAGVAKIAVLTDNIEPVVLVGIGTQGDVDDWSRQRNRDLTPSPFRPPAGLSMTGGSARMDSTNTGGAPAFLAVVRDSVVAHVEADYHVDPARRGWLGHSFGGLFGAWTRSVEPDLFTDLLLVSPSAFWDGGFGSGRSGIVLSAEYEPGGRVFLTYGSDEDGPIRRSVPALAERLDGVAEVSLRSYEGRDHHSVLMPSLWDGLTWLYGR
ncbi:MAG: alpha/beta hydrolase-fold protein [Bacteroidota bacterium]